MKEPNKLYRKHISHALSTILWQEGTDRGVINIREFINHPLYYLSAYFITKRRASDHPIVSNVKFSVMRDIYFHSSKSRKSKRKWNK